MENITAKLASCFVLDTYDSQQPDIPAAAPISPYSSKESSVSSTTSTISTTCRVRNIKHEYYIKPRVLGTGYRGSVRECIDRSNGERYAVKSIPKSDSSVKSSDLAHETILLKEMKHRSIVQLIDVYEDDDYLHIVTDLCKGGELFDKIVEKKSNADDGAPCFEEGEAAGLLHQILTAVSYMHKHGIVHRDIKPENILFETTDKNSPIKIIDFGLARKHFGNRGEPPMSNIVGTPYYIAPEVLGRKYDKSCDLWSIGVLTYILLCGYPPFNGANTNELHDSVRRGKYNFPAEDWSGVSLEAMNFIRRLLQMDPGQRMTAEEALDHPWMTRHVNTNTDEAIDAVNAEEVMVRRLRFEDRLDAIRKAVADEVMGAAKTEEVVINSLEPEDQSGVSKERRNFIRRFLKKLSRKHMTVKQALDNDWMV